MSKLGYHRVVRHWIPASVALLALIAFPVLFSSPSSAQAPGPAVHGFSGAPFTGAVQPPTGAVRPPTGAVGQTFLGPGAYGSGPGGYFPNASYGFRHSRTGEHNGQHHHYRNNFGEYGYVPYAVAIPYAPDYDGSEDQAADRENDPDEQGGPTVFDRRGLGAESYIPPVENGLSPHVEEAPAQNTADEEPQQPTVLVFKDGHKLEVQNYAILGDTLFDLTPGHPRRIALASLNLDATREENENHGVVFQLPGTQGS